MRLSDWCSPLLAVTLCLGGLDASAEDALSYLKPVGPKKCEWVRQPLPSGEPSTLLAFDQPCLWAWMSWSADRRQGLVSMTVQTDDTPAPPPTSPAEFRRRIPAYRLWLVDLVEKKSTQLDVRGLLTATAKAAKGTDAPIIYRRGFDAEGRPVVLLALIANMDQGRTSFSFEGKRYPAPDAEGYPGLALAYRWTGAKWERFELKATTYESPGLDALRATKVLAASDLPELGDLVGKEAAPELAKTLDKTLKQEEAGHWMAAPSPGGTFVYWAESTGAQEDSEDGTRPFVGQPPVRWEQNGVLSKVEPLSSMSEIEYFDSLQLQGHWLVINAEAGKGLPSVFVYDLQTKKLVLSLPEAQHARLWP
jgi:hypothetical protein